MERNLKQFIVVAETGSITAASEKLFVSQPTITVNIRNLESAHGVALFERTPRGMVLTEYGSILYESARVIERVELQASANIQRRRLGQGQAIRIGCGHAWWSLFLRETIGQLVGNDSEASIHVETGSNLQCMWKMLSGEISVSVGHQIENLDPAINTRFVPLFKSVDGHFVARDHPLAGRCCRMEDLQEFPAIVSVPCDLHYSKVLFKGSPGSQAQPETDDVVFRYSSNSLMTCVDMVIWSRGYTSYPMDMAAGLEALGLVPVPLLEAGPPKDIGLYYPVEHDDSVEIKDLVDRITLAARNYAAQRQPSC